MRTLGEFNQSESFTQLFWIFTLVLLTNVVLVRFTHPGELEQVTNFVYILLYMPCHKLHAHTECCAR